MTRYEETIAAMKTMRTLSGHITNLGKLWAKTEDQQLHKLLGDLITTLQRTHAIATAKGSKVRGGTTTPGALINGTDAEIKALTHYCQANISAKKPEWQVLAEHHGWTPPQA